MTDNKQVEQIADYQLNNGKKESAPIIATAKPPQWVMVDGRLGEAPEKIEDCFEVDFDGYYFMQISKIEGVWKVTNAVDGYGNNAKELFTNSKITFLTESSNP
jgi:hypothetical protein